jgi:putative secretion ATPase (PEP-CTERM system associated)
MYEAFYKFQGKPFRLTPDPAMLFPSKSHKRAMSYLMYGFEQGEGFVMITGAVGTGKTLLLQKLFEDLAHRNVTIANIASANLDSDDVLPAVASELNLPFEGRSKEALLHDLKQHLVARSARHSRTLLVVDEAQTLTPAALEMLRILSNLEQRGRALLQVFLVGQSDLRHVIVANRMEQLRQRIIATFRLEPMEFDESREYILHRLHAVGWKSDPRLDPAIFGGVHQASRGIPRKINQIMDRLLLFGYLEERHALDQAALTTVLKELAEEMPEVPQTLEPTVPLRGVAAVHAASPAEHESELATLEHQRNKILLQLMREEQRLKQILEGGSPPTPVEPAAVQPEEEHLGTVNDDFVTDPDRGSRRGDRQR